MAARVLGGADWATWRELRFRALAESPSAFGSTRAQELAFTEQFWRSRLDDPDGVSVLAEVEGSAVGMGGAFQDRPGLLHVVAMWVAPDHRGVGLAHDLLRVIEDRAADRGLALHLDVNTENTSARSSYERYGFVATGETERLRPGSDEVIERMVLTRPR